MEELRQKGITAVKDKIVYMMADDMAKELIVQLWIDGYLSGELDEINRTNQELLKRA